MIVVKFVKSSESQSFENGISYIKKYLCCFKAKAVDVVFPHVSCSTYWEPAGSLPLAFLIRPESRSVNLVGGYLSWQRPDVIKLLPPSATRDWLMVVTGWYWRQIFV